MKMATALTELKRMQKASIVKGDNLKTKLKQQEELLEYHCDDVFECRLTEYVIGYIQELIDQNNYYKQGIEKAIQLIELSNNSAG